MLLDLLVETGIQGVAPCLLGGVGQLNANGLGGGYGLRVVGDDAKVNAYVLLTASTMVSRGQPGVRSIFSPIHSSS